MVCKIKYFVYRNEGKKCVPARQKSRHGSECACVCVRVFDCPFYKHHTLRENKAEKQLFMQTQRYWIKQFLFIYNFTKNYWTELCCLIHTRLHILFNYRTSNSIIVKNKLIYFWYSIFRIDQAGQMVLLH